MFLDLFGGASFWSRNMLRLILHRDDTGNHGPLSVDFSNSLVTPLDSRHHKLDNERLDCDVPFLAYLTF